MHQKLRTRLQTIVVIVLLLGDEPRLVDSLSSTSRYVLEDD